MASKEKLQGDQELVKQFSPVPRRLAALIERLHALNNNLRAIEDVVDYRGDDDDGIDKMAHDVQGLIGQIEGELSHAEMATIRLSQHFVQL